MLAHPTRVYVFGWITNNDYLYYMTVCLEMPHSKIFSTNYNRVKYNIQLFLKLVAILDR